MIIKHKTIIIFCVILAFVLHNNIIAQSKSVNLFDKIVNITNSTIEEVGIKASFKVNKYGKIVPEEILKKLELSDLDYIERTENIKYNTINFSGKRVKGYIENIKEDKESTVIISIEEKTWFNNLEEIKEKISKLASNKDLRIKYEQYLRAKVKNDTVSNINDKIYKLLNDIGSDNLESIPISNGYSTIGNTGVFDSIYINDRKVDFSYAVTKYSSGVYITIGTPIINSSY